MTLHARGAHGRARTRDALAALAACVVLASSATTRAQSAAATPPTSGEVSLARQLFATGAAAFQGAYGLVHQPDILFNLGGALERSGQLGAAAERLRQFLQEATAGPAAVHREAARAALASIEQRIPRVRLSVRGLAPRDRVVLDGRTLLAASLERALAVDPGRHVVVVLRAGQPVARQWLAVPAGGVQSHQVVVPPPPPPCATHAGACAVAGVTSGALAVAAAVVIVWAATQCWAEPGAGFTPPRGCF